MNPVLASQSEAASSAAGGTSVWTSKTFRQFSVAAAFMTGLVLLLELLMMLEPVEDPAHGAIGGRPVRSAMIFTGVAHFTIAFLFSWTSASVSEPGGRRSILLGLGIGGILCFVSYSGHAWAPIVFPSGFVAIFFLVHELRDEYLFSRSYGDVPPRSGFDRRGLFFLLAAAVCGALAVVWTVPFIRQSQRQVELFQPLFDLNAPTTAPKLTWWLGPVLVLSLLGATLLRQALRRRGLSLAGFWLAYRPLGLVYAGIALILLAGVQLEKALFPIVLFHVMAWWVYTSKWLELHGREEGPRQLGWVTWFKQTQRGFQTLHVGLTVLVAALAVVWAYGFGRSSQNVLAWLLTVDGFNYWTIMHVTASFVPRRT